jgi:site-specific recombinase XerD
MFHAAMNDRRRLNHRDLTLQAALEGFLRALDGRNRSGATIEAYRADIGQFLNWLGQTNVVALSPADIDRLDVAEFLSHLAQRKLSGVSRARKLAAIREYFRHLVDVGQLERSPAEGLETPRKEKNTRPYLQTDEYNRMLSLAGAKPRDFAILQVFLQTGVRVSELCSLRLEDVDLEHGRLHVVGKGQVERTIDLERKGIQAIKNWLAVRPTSLSEALFLNYQSAPIGTRGVQKLIFRYRTEAGITKRAGCHALRHTFATRKAERGVSPFQLKEWLGHANLNTSQIYVHMGKQNARKVMEDTSL